MSRSGWSAARWRTKEPPRRKAEEGEDWEDETVATEGDITLQDYQEATEAEETRTRGFEE